MAMVRGITIPTCRTYKIIYSIIQKTNHSDIFYYLPVNVYYRISQYYGYTYYNNTYMYTFLASVRPKGVLETQCSLVQYNLYLYTY